MNTVNGFSNLKRPCPFDYPQEGAKRCCVVEEETSEVGMRILSYGSSSESSDSSYSEEPESSSSSSDDLFDPSSSGSASGSEYVLDSFDERL